MLQSALEIVCVIFLLMALGFLLERKGWLGANATTVLSRLTLRVGLPGLIVSNLLGQYDRAMLLQGMHSLLAPFLLLGGLYLFSGLLTRWLRLPQTRRGVFRALFTFGNAVFVGLPVCRAILGEAAVSDVLLFYLASTLLWWLIGAPQVARDGGTNLHNPLRRLASPPLVACLISLLLVLAGFRPPQLLLTVASYLGNLVTPLSMLFIGCTLCHLFSHGLRWQKGYSLMLLGRFVLAPLLCLPLCLLLRVPAQALSVFFLEAGMPAQTQTCLWAQEQGADAEYAAGGVALSTLISLAAIPAYAWIIERLPI